jgi:hypothetical protein
MDVTTAEIQSVVVHQQLPAGLQLGRVEERSSSGSGDEHSAGGAAGAARSVSERCEPARPSCYRRCDAAQAKLVVVVVGLVVIGGLRHHRHDRDDCNDGDDRCVVASQLGQHVPPQLLGRLGVDGHDGNDEHVVHDRHNCNDR